MSKVERRCLRFGNVLPKLKQELSELPDSPPSPQYAHSSLNKELLEMIWLKKFNSYLNSKTMQTIIAKEGKKTQNMTFSTEHREDLITEALVIICKL